MVDKAGVQRTLCQRRAILSAIYINTASHFEVLHLYKQAARALFKLLTREAGPGDVL